MLSCVELAKHIRLGNSGDEQGLSVIPEPSLSELESSGDASVTLRLGWWFLVLRQSSHPFFDVLPGSSEARSSRKYFVPFNAGGPLAEWPERGNFSCAERVARLG